jgi:hypothetical protein
LSCQPFSSNNNLTRPQSPPPKYTINDAPPFYINSVVNYRQYQRSTAPTSSIHNSTTHNSNYQIVSSKQSKRAHCIDNPPAYTHSINCPTFIIGNPQISKKSTRSRKHPTGYNIFYRQEFHRIHESNPNLQASEVSRLVSSRWREMDKDEKTPYERQSRSSAGIKKKRPLNGYHIFCKDVFSNIQQQEPSGGVASWSRTAGSMWKQLSPEEQLQYRRRAMEN